MSAERVKNGEPCTPLRGRIRVQFSLPERDDITAKIKRKDSGALPSSCASPPNRFACSVTPISCSKDEKYSSSKLVPLKSSSCAVISANSDGSNRFAIEKKHSSFKGRSARYRANPVIPGVLQPIQSTAITSARCEDTLMSSDENSLKTSDDCGEGLWMSSPLGECQHSPLSLISNWKTKLTLTTPFNQCASHSLDSDNTLSSRSTPIKMDGTGRTDRKKEYDRSGSSRSSFRRNECSAPSLGSAASSPLKNSDWRPFPLSVLVAKSSPAESKHSKGECSKDNFSSDSGVSRTQRLVKRLSLKKSLSLGVTSGDKPRNNGTTQCMKSRLVVVPLGSPVVHKSGVSLPSGGNPQLRTISDTALSKNNSHKVVVKQRSDPECNRQTDSEPASDDRSPAAADSHTLEWCQSQSDQPSSADAVCLSRSVECLQQQLPEGATDDVTSAVKPLHRRQSTPHTLKDVGVFPVDQSRSGQHECDRAVDTEEQQNSSDITASPAATSSTSRISNFFSKHSFKGKPLKRTKSVTKLERKRFQTEISEEPMSCSGSAIVSPSVCSSRLRSSRSHESLLSGNSALSDPATAEDEDEPEEQQQQQPPHCDVSSVLGADPGGSASLLEMMASGDVSVEPVHSSLMDGQQFCIQVTHNDRRHSPRLYSCRTASERDRWIQSLRAIVQPNREKTLRVDRSLRVWLLEAKDVSQKKRYYCELYLDDTLYARTSSKAKQELCFWGDQFELNSLPALSTLQVRLYREPERKRRKEKVLFIGHVTIPVSSVTKRFYVEKWYPVVLDKNCTSKFTVPPSIRVKCRYQCVDILPLNCYNQFLNYISTRYRQLCAFLEPTIGVKYKEHIAGALVAIMQRQSLVHHLLADLVLLDVNNVDDHRLTFRGNSLATKATECYMRMVGERYLSETLGEPVRHLLNSGCGDLEVDPLKVAGANALKRQRAALRVAVERMWQAILRSYSSFPRELRACFNTIWQRLQNSDRADMCENVISSCIFLRFFCPAILSPSLFGLVQEYPDEKGVRNLTLVAKALQTLANFSQFSGKENYMEFLNDFITEQSKTMRLFLQKITLNAADNNSSGGGQSGHEWDGVIDLGRHLSLLHSLLSECLSSSGGGSGGGGSDKTTAPDLLGERKLLQAALDSVRQTPPTSSVTSSQATPSSCVSPSSDCSVSNRNLAGANSTQRLVANTGRRDGQSVYSPIGTASRFGTTSSSTTSSSSASSCSSAGYNNHQRRRQGSVAVAADPSSTTAAASSDHRSRTLPRHVLSSHSATLSQQQQLARSAVDNRQLHLQHDTGGSQMSISQLSTVASSGYQSQGGTSPVDLTASSSQPVRRVQPHADIYSATLHSARGGYRQAMGRPLIPASPSPQQHQRPLVPVNKTNIASDNSDTQFPLRTARHCRTQSKLLTLAGAISMDDVQSGVAPTTSSVRLTRSSSSSLSPPRERRLAVNSRTTPRTAPPPPPTTESGDPSDSSRLARTKNARRASVEVLATRRQHMHTDSDSSGGNSRARTRTRNRRSRHYEKTFEEYEEEIRLLQCQMEQLQSRLDAEIPPGHTRIPGTYPGVRHQKVVTEARTDHSDGGVAVTAPITNILNRLSVVEDELRREQSQLTCALTEKERVIQAQSMRIAELNAANCQLLACLQETVCSPQTVPQTTPAPAHTTVSAVVSDTSDYKSSSC